MLRRSYCVAGQGRTAAVGAVRVDGPRPTGRLCSGAVVPAEESGPPGVPAGGDGGRAAVVAGRGVKADVQGGGGGVGVGVEPLPAGPDFQCDAAGSDATVAEVADVVEELPGCAAVGYAGDGDAELGAAVVEPAIQVGVLGQNVCKFAAGSRILKASVRELAGAPVGCGVVRVRVRGISVRRVEVLPGFLFRGGGGSAPMRFRSRRLGRGRRRGGRRIRVGGWRWG